MEFDTWLRFLTLLHGATDVFIVAMLVWMLWITRQIVEIQIRLSKVVGELEIMRNNRKVVLGG